MNYIKKIERIRVKQRKEERKGRERRRKRLIMNWMLTLKFDYL